MNEWNSGNKTSITRTKNASLISAPIPIKYLPEGKKVIHSLIDPRIKEGNCSDAWKFVARPYTNGSYHIKGIYFDHYYSPVVHADYFRIKAAIAAMHRLNAKILDVSNEFQNTYVTNNKIVCVSQPHYYIYWFEIS